MKINHISQVYGVDLQKAAGNTKATNADKPKKGDSVSVSSEGKVLENAASSMEAASKRIESLPEVRWDKVEQIKQKVQNGFYETQEFREQLAERLIRDFGLENP